MINYLCQGGGEGRIEAFEIPLSDLALLGTVGGFKFETIVEVGDEGAEGEEEEDDDDDDDEEEIVPRGEWAGEVGEEGEEGETREEEELLFWG